MPTTTLPSLRATSGLTRDDGVTRFGYRGKVLLLVPLEVAHELRGGVASKEEDQRIRGMKKDDNEHSTAIMHSHRRLLCMSYMIQYTWLGALGNRS